MSDLHCPRRSGNDRSSQPNSTPPRALTRAARLVYVREDPADLADRLTASTETSGSGSRTATAAPRPPGENTFGTRTPTSGSNPGPLSRNCRSSLSSRRIHFIDVTSRCETARRRGRRGCSHPPRTQNNLTIFQTPTANSTMTIGITSQSNHSESRLRQHQNRRFPSGALLSLSESEETVLSHPQSTV